MILHTTKACISIVEAVPRLVLRVYTYNSRPLVYRILDQSNSEIRLLKVRSVESVWGIQSLKLVHAQLIPYPVASAPSFVAVSYRWSVDHRVPIIVDGRRCDVSSSIHQLLITLQSEASDSQDERYLWIDSICINQADRKEKSWQIGLMKDVYSSAKHVLGWLGPTAPPISTWRGIDGVRDAVAVICNDFFFRTWIIQEISLAKKVVMRTRHDACLWDGGVVGISRNQGPSFALYGENQFGLPSEIMPRMEQGIKNMNSMESFRNSLSAHPDGSPISELLVRSVEFQCSDPRDRIYGLLGLTTDDARSAISVKYHDDYSELDASIEAARFSLTDESSFQLLEMSGISADLGEFPSRRAAERVNWVPDWQNPHIARMRETLTHAKSHETATHRRCRVRPLAKHKDDIKSLHIEGAIVDTVKEMITPAWTLPKTCDFQDKKSLNQVYHFLDNLDLVCEIARKDQEVGTGDTHDAIMRTVLDAGSLIKEDPPDLTKLRADMERMSSTLRARLPGVGDRVQRSSIVEMDLRHFIMGLEEFMPLVVERRLCVTEQGRFGIVPPRTECGDKVCAFSGAPDPFVLRSCNVSNSTALETYQLVGVCCVDQIIRGELAGADLNWEMLCVV
ncbi:heterokaryon incompatibility protein-domain-containing protein [Xylaria arbuscula]|nr:heterokaryon incompatibility protein-domain-containing protein [Xylaria arbuscula]